MKSLVLAATAVLLLASSARASVLGDWSLTIPDITPISANGQASSGVANGVVSLSASSQYVWDSANSVWTGQGGTAIVGVYSDAGALALATVTPDAAFLHFQARVQYTGCDPITSAPGTSRADWPNGPAAFVSVIYLDSRPQVDISILGSAWNDYYVPLEEESVLVIPVALSQLSDAGNQLGAYDPAAIRILSTSADFRDFTFVATPEPVTIVLLCAGVAGLLRRRTR